ncbi:MAG TPA: hypothetical protein VE710_22885 [Candidatus Bathyarchaeia archaeon]|nr:hypothetical protein [Candidatus Bathyarchaeia archaeon]
MQIPQPSYHFGEAGHVAQNLHISAKSLGLGATTVGHWYDKKRMSI